MLVWITLFAFLVTVAVLYVREREEIELGSMDGCLAGVGLACVDPVIRVVRWLKDGEFSSFSTGEVVNKMFGQEALAALLNSDHGWVGFNAINEGIAQISLPLLVGFGLVIASWAANALDSLYPKKEIEEDEE